MAWHACFHCDTQLSAFNQSNYCIQGFDVYLPTDINVAPHRTVDPNAYMYVRFIKGHGRRFIRNHRTTVYLLG